MSDIYAGHRKYTVLKFPLFERAQANVMRLSKAWLAVAIGTLGVATPAFCQSAPATELLGSAAIRRSLVGKLISSPGWADSGIQEAFRKDGAWGGVARMRGPVVFSGRWSVEANLLCVVADKGSFAEKWNPGKYCRQVWRDKRTGQLMLNHLTAPHVLQTVSICEFDTLTVLGPPCGKANPK